MDAITVAYRVAGQPAFTVARKEPLQRVPLYLLQCSTGIMQCECVSHL